MKNLYNTRVNAYGGRAGKVKSEDGILELDLALPKELGGKGDAPGADSTIAAARRYLARHRVVFGGSSGARGGR